MPPMLNAAFVTRVVAKPGQEEALAKLLMGTQPLVEADSAAPVWLTLRASTSVFYIVNAFPDAATRQRNMEGPIAAGLMAHAATVLAEPPEIVPVDVMFAKITT